MPRYKREKRRLYGGASSETLVQAHPYDYVPSDESADRHPKHNRDLPSVPAAAFIMGSPVSVNPPSTRRKLPPTSGSDNSHTSLPYFAEDTGPRRSATVSSQSSVGSIYSVNLAQQSRLTNSRPSIYVPETPASPASVRPTSIRPGVRPLSIAGRPGSIRPTVPESPFDSRRVCSFYPTQPTIREYSKRDTIFGKRSMDERGRVDLLAEDVPGTPLASKTSFSSPRPAPRPPLDLPAAPASTSYASSSRSVPVRNKPPTLTLNTTMLSSMTEPTSPTESSPSLSTMHFATRPSSGVTAPSRSNSKGESLFSPSERDKRSSTGSKSHKERRRSSLIPSVPPLPPLPEPEPEPEPISYVPLAPPPPVTTRHQRGAGSLGSMNSVNGFTVGTPMGAMFNSPTAKNRPFVVVGLPGSPRPVKVPSPLSPRERMSQSPPLRPFAMGMNANASQRMSGMRVVDLEAGVVDIVEEKRGWSKVRSMMGVVGDTNKDHALFEIVGSPPPLPSPAQWQGQGRGQWQGPRQGQMQGPGRTQGPRAALPGKVGGPRVLKKPTPLALGGLSNFEPPVYGSGSGNGNGNNNDNNGARKRFVRGDVVVTAKTNTPPGINSSTPGWKKLSILESAIINGWANKEEIELVTGMKMDV